MQTWRFVEGKFEAVEFSWTDDIADWDECKQRAGFRDTGLQMGSESFDVTVWVRDRPYDGVEGIPDEYMVDVTVGSPIETVLLPNFPSLMAFLSQVVPIIDTVFASERAQAPHREASREVR